MNWRIFIFVESFRWSRMTCNWLTFWAHAGRTEQLAERARDLIARSVERECLRATLNVPFPRTQKKARGNFHFPFFRLRHKRRESPPPTKFFNKQLDNSIGGWRDLH